MVAHRLKAPSRSPTLHVQGIDYLRAARLPPSTWLGRRPPDGQALPRWPRAGRRPGADLTAVGGSAKSRRCGSWIPPPAGPAADGPRTYAAGNAGSRPTRRDRDHLLGTFNFAAFAHSINSDWPSTFPGAREVHTGPIRGGRRSLPPGAPPQPASLGGAPKAGKAGPPHRPQGEPGKGKGAIGHVHGPAKE